MGEYNFGNRMKGIVIGTQLAASLVGFSSGAFAAESHSVSVKVNEAVIQMYEAPAYIDTNSQLTYVPLRFVSEALGAEINYVSNKTPIVASIDEPESHKVSLTLNSKKVTIDGQAKTIEGAAVLQNGRTMVPLRVISEGLGAEITFTPAKNGQNAVVEVNTPWETPAAGATATPNPSATPAPTSRTDSQYNTWNPDAGQVASGMAVFKQLIWDAKTRTLSFKLPSTTTYDGTTYDVQVALKDGNKTAVALKTEELQIVTGLSKDFRVSIYFDALELGESLDKYFIMSKSFATNNYGYTGNIDDELVVYDSHKNLVTLDTVYKVLGINN